MVDLKMCMGVHIGSWPHGFSTWYTWNKTSSQVYSFHSSFFHKAENVGISKLLCIGLKRLLFFNKLGQYDIQKFEC